MVQARVSQRSVRRATTARSPGPRRVASATSAERPTGGRRPRPGRAPAPASAGTGPTSTWSYSCSTRPVAGSLGPVGVHADLGQRHVRVRPAPRPAAGAAASTTASPGAGWPQQVLAQRSGNRVLHGGPLLQQGPAVRVEEQHRERPVQPARARCGHRHGGRADRRAPSAVDQLDQVEFARRHRPTGDPLGGQLAGDQHHRHADAGLGAGTDEDHIGQCRVQVAGPERPGLAERVRGGERRAGRVAGVGPVGRGDDLRTPRCRRRSRRSRAPPVWRSARRRTARPGPSRQPARVGPPASRFGTGAST